MYIGTYLGTVAGVYYVTVILIDASFTPIHIVFDGNCINGYELNTLPSSGLHITVGGCLYVPIILKAMLAGA